MFRVISKDHSKHLNGSFLYPFQYSNPSNPYPFINLQSKKVPLSAGASAYTPLCGVTPPPPRTSILVSYSICTASCLSMFNVQYKFSEKNARSFEPVKCSNFFFWTFSFGGSVFKLICQNGRLLSIFFKLASIYILCLTVQQLCQPPCVVSRKRTGLTVASAASFCRWAPPSTWTEQHCTKVSAPFGSHS